MTYFLRPIFLIDLKTQDGGIERDLVLAAAVPALIVGIALACLLVWCCLRRRDVKGCSESRPGEIQYEQSHYQGLDLTAINSGDDNYQSLQVNSVTNEAVN